MSEFDDNYDHGLEGESGTKTLSRPRTKRPSMWKVLLLNDDFTPMDFVTHVLKKFFNKTEVESTSIMLQVHNQGAGIAGVYTYEVAETKVFLVNEHSRKQKHPLKCIMEEDTSGEEGE